MLGKAGRRNAIKDTAYECGMLPEGGSQARFSVKFYLVAMLFILFDIEVVFMYPWAVVYRDFVAGTGPVQSESPRLPASHHHSLEHAFLRLHPHGGLRLRHHERRAGLEKVAAALLFLLGALPAGAQSPSPGLPVRDPAALLYQPVPDFEFASATLPGHSLRQLGLRYRKLVLFAPGPDDPRLKRQLALLAPPAVRAGMRERDMILISVMQKGALQGPAAEAAAAPGVAAACGVAPGSFAALLVGRTNVLKCWSLSPWTRFSSSN